MRSRLTPLIKLFYNPLQAMIEISARAPFVFGAAVLLATSVIHRRASFSVLLRQEYAPLTSCVLYGWAAAHLMMLIPAMLLFRPGGPNATALDALKLVPLPYFIFLIVLAAHAVLRVGYGGAAGVVALGSLS